MTHPRQLFADLVKVGPHGQAHWVALRAAVTVALPLSVLALVDHLPWALYAGFAAFGSLYGRGHTGRARWQMQWRVSLVLVGCVVLGVVIGLSAERAWWAVPAATLVGAAGAALSDRDGWHPPGPLFMIFALCACASVPSTPSDLVPAVVVSSATAAWSLLVGSAGHLARRLRGTGEVTVPARPGAVERRHVVRAAVGVAVAGTLTTALGIGHPYWAMVSAVVPLAARSWEGQVLRGLHRVVGTFAGLALAAGLLAAHLPVPGLLLSIVALQGVAELLIGRNYALALVAVTPLALLMVSLAAPVPTDVLVRDRAVETVIGVVVGVAVGWLTRRRD